MCRRLLLAAGGALGVLSTLAVGLASDLGVPDALAQSGSTVVISEIYYNPPGADEGDSYLELANTSGSAVDISGWSFSEGLTLTFAESTQIAAGGTLVAASDAAAFQQTFGFAPDATFVGSLDNGGETLSLTDADGTVIDTVDYDDKDPWPRSADGSGDSLQLADLSADNTDPFYWGGADPTPGQANTAVLKVRHSIERGFYDGNLSVALTANVANATIRYATDNSNLDQAYSAPISVTDNNAIRVVRAQATLGQTQSKIFSHTYVFHADTGTPVVASWDNDMSPADGDERTQTLEIIMAPSIGLSSVGVDVGMSKSAGGISRGESDKVYFRSEYGTGTLSADLFSDNYYGLEPVPQIDQLYLRDQHLDNTYLRTLISHDAMLEMGALAPHGRPVRYYDGGSLEHRILFERPEGGFMETYLGGDKDDYTAGNGKAREEMQNLIGVEPADGFDAYAARVNIDQMTDTLLSLWMANLGDGLNYRWAGLTTGPFETEAEKVYFFNWDHDLGFGKIYGNRVSRSTGWVNSVYRFQSPGRSTASAHFLNLVQHPEYLRVFSDRAYCSIVSPEAALQPDAMLERIEQRRAELEAAGGPSNSTWMNQMNSWIPQRHTWLVGEMRRLGYLAERSAVTASVEGNEITLTASGGGTIYYMIDGDPRRADGTLDPSAVEYSGPITVLSGLTNLVARAHFPNDDSDLDKWTPFCADDGLLDTTDGNDPLPLVINEINYHPAEGDAEFIEIVNTSDASVNLDGVHFSDGVSSEALSGVVLDGGDAFVFAPDGFEAAYAFAADASYTGALDNGGETLTLSAANGQVIDTVTYDDIEPWPTSPDGLGPSLVLRHLEFDNDDASAWRASAGDGGSPGSLPQVRLGDADCDDQITDDDVLAILAVLVSDLDASSGCVADATGQVSLVNADLTGNATIDLTDGQQLAQCLAEGVEECAELLS